jgi:hypothetical protein
MNQVDGPAADLEQRCLPAVDHDGCMGPAPLEGSQQQAQVGPAAKCCPIWNRAWQLHLFKHSAVSGCDFSHAAPNQSRAWVAPV